MADQAAAAQPSLDPEPYVPGDLDEGIRRLPKYARSLLHISVPVVVTLASTRQPISHILELCPGSIIQLDKSCEEMLTLEVGGRTIAVGQTVKVGDKFGLRITSMTMPEERFWAVRGQGKERDSAS